MPRAHHARRAVNVEPDVPLAGERRFTRVQAHPHAHRQTVGPRVVGKRPLCRRGSRDRVSRARERHKERIACVVDLVARVPRNCVPEQRVVILDERDIAIAERPEQTSRTLDVGEEKGDSAAR